MLNHYWKLNTVLSVFVLSVLISRPTFGMIVPTEFYHFNELLPELKPCVIDHVDNMASIGQANKECYAIVKRKQTQYIIQMQKDQNPSLARLNIPPFMFRSTKYRYSDP